MSEIEFPLGEVLAMQKRFVELYRSVGLLSLNDNYIHVKGVILAQLCDIKTWVISVDSNSSFPVSCRALVNGVEFCAVCTKEEAKTLGLVLTADQLATLGEE